MERDQLRLCFVNDYNKVYFTSDFERQRGDGWHKTPYEHNAGEPYREVLIDGVERPVELFACYVEGNFEIPREWYTNSPWAVEQINKRLIPWLQTARYYTKDGITQIWAGTTYRQFRRLCKQAGWTVYTP